MDNDNLLREIHAIANRVDERTEQHTDQIDALFAKQIEACGKLATLEERTKTHKEELDALRAHAKRSGGGAGASVAGGLILGWELFKAYIRGDGG